MSEQQTPRTAEQRFPGAPGSVAEVRAWARVWLEKFGVPGEAAENAVLVLSELCTNAVQHSRSSGPGGSYLVCLRRGVSMLRVEVADAGGASVPMARRRTPLGNGRPPALGSALAGSVGQEGGHGLALVEAFAARWWTRGDPSSRTVCAELPLHPAA